MPAAAKKKSVFDNPYLYGGLGLAGAAIGAAALHRPSPAIRAPSIKFTVRPSTSRTYSSGFGSTARRSAGSTAGHTPPPGGRVGSEDPFDYAKWKADFDARWAKAKATSSPPPGAGPRTPPPGADPFSGFRTPPPGGGPRTPPPGSGPRPGGARPPPRAVPKLEVMDFSGVKTKAEAKKLYKEMARKHHPDLGGSDEMMKKVNNDWDLFQKSPEFAKLSHFIPGFSDELRKIIEWSTT